MVKKTSRPSGGGQKKDPGGTNTMSFINNKLRQFFSDDEEGKQGEENTNQSTMTGGRSDAGGIQNDGTNDTVMADADTKPSNNHSETSDGKDGEETTQDAEKMDDSPDTDDDRRRTNTRSTSGDTINDSDQRDTRGQTGKTGATSWKIRYEIYVRAGQTFSPVRTMRSILEIVWEADEDAYVEGPSDHFRLHEGSRIPKNKESFAAYFNMEQVESNGTTHVGIDFSLTSSVNVEKLKKLPAMAQFLGDTGAWLNEQGAEFTSPLTKMIGWVATVPPSLAAHNPFVSVLQEAWISHPEYEDLLSDKIAKGDFPPLQLRVARVYADPKNKGEGSVWTLLVEVRCELKFADEVTYLASTGDFGNHPSGIFIAKDAAIDIEFMTEIIQKHNKVNSNIVVIPMEGFCPQLLDAPADTLPGGSEFTVREAIIGLESHVDPGDGIMKRMQLYNGIYERDDSEESGIIYITTTRIAASKASEMLDRQVIPLLKGISCYQSFKMDEMYDGKGIRRKPNRVIVSKNRPIEPAKKDYIEKTRRSLAPIDGHQEEQFNSFKQRPKRHSVPAEIVWTDEDPPVGGGRSTTSSITNGMSYRTAVTNPRRPNQPNQRASNQRQARDDATSVGEGSGDLSAMTLATLHTTIEEQTATIEKQAHEIKELKNQAKKNSDSAEDQEKRIEQQKEFYEQKLEKAEFMYNRKIQVAEGNAALREQTMERRLEEKWEQKLQSMQQAMDDLVAKMATMPAAQAQFVTVNASPSDSSSLTTRTTSQQSPEASTVSGRRGPVSIAATTQSSFKRCAIDTATPGRSDVTETTNELTASTTADAQSGNFSQAIETTINGNRAVDKSTNSTASVNTVSSTGSKRIFNPYAKTTQPQQRADDRSNASSAKSKESNGAKIGVGTKAGQIGTNKPITSSLSNAANQGKSTTTALKVTIGPRPTGNHSTTPSTTTQSTYRAASSTNGSKTDTTNGPPPSDPVTPKTPPRAATDNGISDEMECDKEETSFKRNKETTPTQQQVTPTGQHTHKKSRGRDGSPIRKAAQTDIDRGCEPTKMDIDLDNQMTPTKLQRPESSIQAINDARAAEGMSSLEILTPTKRSAKASTEDGPTPLRTNKTPATSESPKAADKSAISQLGSPPTTKTKLTPLKAKNLSSQLEGKDKEGWENDEWLSKVDAVMNAQEHSNETTGKGTTSDGKVPNQTIQEAGTATTRADPRKYE